VTGPQRYRMPVACQVVLLGVAVLVVLLLLSG
jgi:hypothetical protein